MFQPVIGLEIHIELNTKSKMFCSCSNDPNERHPNVNICPVCTSQPGSLPVINKEAIKKTIKTGLSFNCQIPEYSKFDRKNYFYPDLPKGYQISQRDMPLCKEGFLEIGDRKIRIREVHLEEDTGRLIHEKGYSLVDFNRAGIPLMELVTEPDINSAKEAREFAEELHRILHYLDVSDADMEKGEMRVEVNISLTRAAAKGEEEGLPSSPSQDKGKLGTKVEIKNLNSFRAVEKAIDYEIKRQTKVLESEEKVIQETRGWDDVKEITFSQREKEYAHDYRYFPEPDLPILHLGIPEILNEIRAEIPELPQQKRERLKREYELDEKSIEVFVQNKDLGEYFEKVISELEPRLDHQKLFEMIKLASNYLISDLTGLLKGLSAEDKKFKITAENFAELITLIHQGSVSSRIAKAVLVEMFKTGADPSHIIKEKRFILITDENEIEKIAKKVISKNPKAVLDYKKGKVSSLQFLIGQVMAATKGRVNPKTVQNLLTKILKIA